jgi:hypothetical protein
MIARGTEREGERVTSVGRAEDGAIEDPSLLATGALNLTFAFPQTKHLHRAKGVCDSRLPSDTFIACKEVLQLEDAIRFHRAVLRLRVTEDYSRLA